MNFNDRADSRAAFTLTEAICALLVAALVIITATAVLHTTLRSFTRSTRTLRKTRRQTALGNILRRDVEGCVLAGGEKPSFRVKRTQDGRSSLSIVTTNSLGGYDGDAGGLYRVSYVLKSPAQQYPVRLVRLQKPYTPGDSRDTGDPLEETLATGVDTWKVECYTGSGWREKWQAQSFPVQIRVQFSAGKTRSQKGKNESGAGEQLENEALTFHLSPIASSEETLMPSRDVWPAAAQGDEDETRDGDEQDGETDQD